MVMKNGDEHPDCPTFHLSPVLITSISSPVLITILSAKVATLTWPRG
jgi:hypothetical protein